MTDADRRDSGKRVRRPLLNLKHLDERGGIVSLITHTVEGNLDKFKFYRDEKTSSRNLKEDMIEGH